MTFRSRESRAGAIETTLQTTRLAVLGRSLRADDEEVVVLAEQSAPVNIRGQTDRGERRVVVWVFAVLVALRGEVEVVALDFDARGEARDFFLRHALPSVLLIWLRRIVVSLGVDFDCDKALIKDLLSSVSHKSRWEVVDMSPPYM